MEMRKIIGMLVFLLGFWCAIAGGAVIYVDADANGTNNGTSWENAFTDLQDGLEDAQTNDEIWVAAGTYKPSEQYIYRDMGEEPNNPRYATFKLLDDVEVYGGFAGTETSREQRDWNVNETILSGDIGIPDNNSDNSYRVVTTHQNTDAYIDGFTITGGCANGKWYYTRGGGINNYDNSRITAWNCIFRNNYAKYWGGAVCGNFGCTVAMSYCTFEQNTSSNFGGGVSVFGGSGDSASVLYLGRCVFSENTAYWTGGGVDAYDATLLLRHCILRNNSSEYMGGGVCYESPMVDGIMMEASNSVFSGNNASYYGGGIYTLNNDGESIITNCSLSGNSAIYGGGIYNNYTDTRITSCILWNNGSEIYDANSSSPVVSYCDVEGGYTGSNNIDADPCFVVADPNLHLGLNSPCINTGDPNVIMIPGWTDVDDGPRVIGERVDIGSDEASPPVRWWKLDESSGSTAYDSANGYNGTVYGATWTTGQINGALSFDGTNDYVAIPSYTLNTNNGTISLWFKTSANFSANYGGMGYLISRDSQYYSYLTVAGNGAGPYWIIGETDSQNDYYVAMEGAAAAGLWNNVVVSFDEKVATTYLNSVPIQTEPVTDSYLTLTRIGGRTQEYFNGKIDDVRLYDRALTAKEAEHLYQEGLGPKAYDPNPVNGATDVDVNTALSWSPGGYAISHDVYLGINYNNVNNADTTSAEYKGNYDVNTFDPCGLGPMTTYYWRIDEKSSSSTTKGDVWSFTTYIDPYLTHWWKLDETSGTTAYDSVDTDNGVFNGDDPNWVTGKFDGAVDFDGVTDYFSVASLNSLFNNSSVFTVAGWFKTEQSTGMQTIVGQWSQDSGYYYGWQVLVENKKVVAKFGGDVAPMTEITGTNDVNDGKWHQFALVNNGSSSVALYVDGDPNGTAGSKYMDIYDTKFRIGDGSYGNGNLEGGPFNGMIDNVMIFNRVLSAEEVKQLYEAGS
ncbi:MAG: LamG domain-containing protein [Phycisphaerae bacterium]|nr:LamG domain-containing protein [Phycisphaerae bacterium]MDD5381029.1 LamG domain-containing protein [Phycisphaerae bacterium]